jgi:hypothetical protein
MSTYNLFLSASDADTAITRSHRLFHDQGLTGVNLNLYGANINHWGTINSTALNITGDIGEPSYIKQLTGGIRVNGQSEFQSIIGGIRVQGTSYIQSLTGGLNINGNISSAGNISNVGNILNNGSVTINGGTRITGVTNITGATNIIGNTYIKGNFFNEGTTATIRATTTAISGNTLNLNGTTLNSTFTNFNLGATALNINAQTQIQGNTNVNGTLSVNGVPITNSNITNVSNYFLTGGECVEAINVGGGVIQGRYADYDLVSANEGSPTGVARGEYAIDLQMVRQNTSQVAAASGSAILGGRWNATKRSTSQGDWATVVGGLANTGLGPISVILGGSQNETSSYAEHSVVFGNRAVSYNDNELAQGNGSVYGYQRTWLVGNGSLNTDGINFGSGIFNWDQTNFSYPYILAAPNKSISFFLKGYGVISGPNTGVILMEGIGFADANNFYVTTTRSLGVGVSSNIVFFTGSRESAPWAATNTAFKLGICSNSAIGATFSVAVDTISNNPLPEEDTGLFAAIDLNQNLDVLFS